MGSPGPTRFFVELRRPHAGWAQLEALVQRARRAAESVTRDGSPVRFLRSVYVPEDGTCYFLYEAVSVDAVLEAGRRGDLDIGPVGTPLDLD